MISHVIAAYLKWSSNFFIFFLNLNYEITVSWKAGFGENVLVLWLNNWGCPRQRYVMSEELTMQLMMIILNLSILRTIKNHVDSFWISEAVSQVLTKINRNVFINSRFLQSIMVLQSIKYRVFIEKSFK